MPTNPYYYLNPLPAEEEEDLVDPKDIVAQMVAANPTKPWHENTPQGKPYNPEDTSNIGMSDYLMAAPGLLWDAAAPVVHPVVETLKPLAAPINAADQAAGTAVTAIQEGVSDIPASIASAIYGEKAHSNTKSPSRIKLNKDAKGLFDQYTAPSLSQLAGEGIKAAVHAVPELWGGQATYDVTETTGLKEETEAQKKVWRDNTNHAAMLLGMDPKGVMQLEATGKVIQELALSSVNPSGVALNLGTKAAAAASAMQAGVRAANQIQAGNLTGRALKEAQKLVAAGVEATKATSPQAVIRAAEEARKVGKVAGVAFAPHMGEAAVESLKRAHEIATSRDSKGKERGYSDPEALEAALGGLVSGLFTIGGLVHGVSKGEPIKLTKELADQYKIAPAPSELLKAGETGEPSVAFSREGKPPKPTKEQLNQLNAVFQANGPEYIETTLLAAKSDIAKITEGGGEVQKTPQKTEMVVNSKGEKVIAYRDAKGEIQAAAIMDPDGTIRDVASTSKLSAGKVLLTAMDQPGWKLPAPEKMSLDSLKMLANRDPEFLKTLPENIMRPLEGEGGMEVVTSKLPLEGETTVNLDDPLEAIRTKPSDKTTTINPNDPLDNLRMPFRDEITEASRQAYKALREAKDETSIAAAKQRLERLNGSSNPEVWNRNLISRLVREEVPDLELHNNPDWTPETPVSQSDAKKIIDYYSKKYGIDAVYHGEPPVGDKTSSGKLRAGGTVTLETEGGDGNRLSIIRSVQKVMPGSSNRPLSTLLHEIWHAKDLQDRARADTLRRTNPEYPGIIFNNELPTKHHGSFEKFERDFLTERMKTGKDELFSRAGEGDTPHTPTGVTPGEMAKAYAEKTGGKVTETETGHRITYDNDPNYVLEVRGNNTIEVAPESRASLEKAHPNSPGGLIRGSHQKVEGTHIINLLDGQASWRDIGHEVGHAIMAAGKLTAAEINRLYKEHGWKPGEAMAPITEKIMDTFGFWNEERINNPQHFSKAPKVIQDFFRGVQRIYHAFQEGRVGEVSLAEIQRRYAEGGIEGGRKFGEGAARKLGEFLGTGPDLIMEAPPKFLGNTALETAQKLLKGKETPIQIKAALKSLGGTQEVLAQLVREEVPGLSAKVQEGWNGNTPLSRADADTITKYYADQLGLGDVKLEVTEGHQGVKQTPEGPVIQVDLSGNNPTRAILHQLGSLADVHPGDFEVGFIKQHFDPNEPKFSRPVPGKIGTALAKKVMQGKRQTTNTPAGSAQATQATGTGGGGGIASPAPPPGQVPQPPASAKLALIRGQGHPVEVEPLIRNMIQLLTPHMIAEETSQAQTLSRLIDQLGEQKTAQKLGISVADLQDFKDVASPLGSGLAALNAFGSLEKATLQNALQNPHAVKSVRNMIDRATSGNAINQAVRKVGEKLANLNNNVSALARAGLAGGLKTIINNLLSGTTLMTLNGLENSAIWAYAKAAGDNALAAKYKGRGVFSVWGKAIPEFLISPTETVMVLGERLKGNQTKDFAKVAANYPKLNQMLLQLKATSEGRAVREFLKQFDPETESALFERHADDLSFEGKNLDPRVQKTVDFLLSLNMAQDRIVRMAEMKVAAENFIEANRSLLGPVNGQSALQMIQTAAKANPAFKAHALEFFREAATDAMRSTGGLKAVQGTITESVINTAKRVPVLWPLVPFANFPLANFLPAVMEYIPVSHLIPLPFNARERFSAQRPNNLKTLEALKKQHKTLETLGRELKKNMDALPENDKAVRIQRSTENAQQMAILKDQITKLEAKTKLHFDSGLYDPHKVIARQTAGAATIVALFAALRAIRGDDGTNWDEVGPLPGSTHDPNDPKNVLNIRSALGPLGPLAAMGDYLGHNHIGSDKYQGEKGTTLIREIATSLGVSRMENPLLNTALQPGGLDEASLGKSLKAAANNVGRMTTSMAWVGDLLRMSATRSPWLADMMGTSEDYERRSDLSVWGGVQANLLPLSLPPKFDPTTGKPLVRKGAQEVLSTDTIGPLRAYLNSNPGWISSNAFARPTSDPAYDAKVMEYMREYYEESLIPEMNTEDFKGQKKEVRNSWLEERLSDAVRKAHDYAKDDFISNGKKLPPEILDRLEKSEVEKAIRKENVLSEASKEAPRLKPRQILSESGRDAQEKADKLLEYPKLHPMLPPPTPAQEKEIPASVIPENPLKLPETPEGFGRVSGLPAPVEDQIFEVANKSGVSPTFAMSVAIVESRGRAGATSHRGARGYFQLMPRTAEAMGVTDPNDPSQNITGGIKYLAELIKKYGSNRPDLVLAGYNAGPGKVAAHGGEVPPFKETQDYIERVMTTYEKLQKNYNLIMQAPPAALTKGAQTP